MGLFIPVRESKLQGTLIPFPTGNLESKGEILDASAGVWDLIMDVIVGSIAFDLRELQEGLVFLLPRLGVD